MEAGQPMKALLAIKRGFLAFARTVGRIVGFVVALLLYVFLVGPYSIVYRVALGDVLGERPDPRMKSYWRRLPVDRKHPERPY
jgi:hypothetical protein